MKPMQISHLLLLGAWLVTGQNNNNNRLCSQAKMMEFISHIGNCFPDGQIPQDFYYSNMGYMDEYAEDEFWCRCFEDYLLTDESGGSFPAVCVLPQITPIMEFGGQTIEEAWMEMGCFNSLSALIPILPVQQAYGQCFSPNGNSNGGGNNNGGGGGDEVEEEEDAEGDDEADEGGDDRRRLQDNLDCEDYGDQSTCGSKTESDSKTSCGWTDFGSFSYNDGNTGQLHVKLNYDDIAAAVEDWTAPCYGDSCQNDDNDDNNDNNNSQQVVDASAETCGSYGLNWYIKDTWNYENQNVAVGPENCGWYYTGKILTSIAWDAVWENEHGYGYYNGNNNNNQDSREWEDECLNDGRRLADDEDLECIGNLSARKGTLVMQNDGTVDHYASDQYLDDALSGYLYSSADVDQYSFVVACSDQYRTPLFCGKFEVFGGAVTNSPSQSPTYEGQTPSPTLESGRSAGDGEGWETVKNIAIVGLVAGLLGIGFCWFKKRSRLTDLGEPRPATGQYQQQQNAESVCADQI